MRLPFDGVYPITQGFGENPDFYAQCCNEPAGHNGIDFGLPSGTRVLAPDAGVVTFAGSGPQRGNYVTIGHPNGNVSYLLHLDHALVNQGSWVDAGAPVAISDNTGLSTGPHLHWGVYDPSQRGNAFDGYVNPLALLTPATPGPGPLPGPDPGWPPVSGGNNDAGGWYPGGGGFGSASGGGSGLVAVAGLAALAYGAYLLVESGALHDLVRHD